MSNSLTIRTMAQSLKLSVFTVRRWLWKLDIEPDKYEQVQAGKRRWLTGIYKPDSLARVIQARKLDQAYPRRKR